ncbi:MAG: dihydrofolate reductase [Patescibacteria group bacterium]|jgi:dihydrofolate reductase
MITLIAGISKNNCIGKNGSLPWRIPEDMKHFKDLTMDHPVIMGRKTWESIPEKFRPLPGRRNIVVTRQSDYALPEGVDRAGSVDEAIDLARDPFVIGGTEIYAQAMERADRLEITHVDQNVDGDAFFPTIDPAMWAESMREDHDGFSFVTYERHA